MCSSSDVVENQRTKLYTAAAVRELDRMAIAGGIPGRVLMERAGMNAYAALRKHWPEASRVNIVTGRGNNAGDGFVIARLAATDGLEVRVLQVGSCANLSDVAGDALAALRRAGIEPQPFNAALISSQDVLVDALLGTGLDREVSGEYAAAVIAMNASGAHILAVDIPSGLGADGGQILGVAVRASLTVTFIGIKQGLLTGAGPDCCGKLLFASLDVPNGVYDAVPATATWVNSSTLQARLQPRVRNVHKGNFGHVLVIGGDMGYAGAARMAAEAAARTGSGLVSLATRQAHAGLITATIPEVMAHGVEQAADLAGLLTRATVIAIGPGLGQSPWAKALFSAVLQCNVPIVVDADALNLLAIAPTSRDHWILTPHPGEASRLLGCSVRSLQEQRFVASQQLQLRYGGVCVLKGCGSIIAGGETVPSVCTLGNPGMASGGMGDVLTGVIAGLLAQNLPLREAAETGVLVHAMAGDRAALRGQRGMMASDVLKELRTVVNPDQDHP